MKELFTPVWTERERKGKVPDENCYSKSVLRWMTGWKQGESLLANILGISSKSASDGGWDETRAKRFRERKESFNILKRQIPLQREWLSQNTGHTAPPCSEKWRPGHGTLPPGWKDTFKAVMCILSLAFDILRRESSQTNKKMSLFQTSKKVPKLWFCHSVIPKCDLGSSQASDCLLSQKSQCAILQVWPKTFQLIRRLSQAVIIIPFIVFSNAFVILKNAQAVTIF